jgi:L-gulono-1,4-lactone dehydrogenase
VTSRPAQWTNWGRTFSYRPTRMVTPADAAEVVAVMATARRDGLRIKPLGSGHSFSPLTVTDGVQVRLDRLTGLVGTDIDSASGEGTVTVGAGTTLRALNAELARRGLGLANMGDIDVQTVSGAIATGTHGSGRASASLSALVVALEIALPDGSLVRCSAAHEPDLFCAGQLGLGALGIVTSVTFRVERAFRLHAVEAPGSLDDLLEHFDEYAASEHLDVHWLPFTDAVLIKHYRRTDEPMRPLPKLVAWWTDVVENAGVELVQRVARAAPRYAPFVNTVAARLISARDYVDAAPSVFVSVRRVHFHEMEYALPRRVAVAAIREFRRLTIRGPWRIAFPVQVRLAPADDIWLSGAYDRETVYVACHAFPRTDYRGWFAAAEELFVSYGGRPHWGKLHTRDVGDLEHAFPRMSEFRAVRNQVDPDRLMDNDYLRQVLGD